MATSFTVKQLPKTDGSLTRSPNFHKYYIKCSGRITSETPTSEPWLHVLRLIKTDISDIDRPTNIQDEHLRCSSLYDLSASLAHDTIEHRHTEGMPVFNVHGSKSRILLGSLQKYGEIVVKIGDSESMH